MLGKAPENTEDSLENKPMAYQRNKSRVLTVKAQLTRFTLFYFGYIMKTQLKCWEQVEEKRRDNQ